MNFFCLVFATLDRPRVVPRHNRDQLGLGIQGSGFRVQGSGFRVQGSSFSVPDSGLRIAVRVCHGLRCGLPRGVTCTQTVPRRARM